MPLGLNDSFLRKIPGDLSTAQPWWTFGTKGVNTRPCGAEWVVMCSAFPNSPVTISTSSDQNWKTKCPKEMRHNYWALLKTQPVLMSAGPHVLVRGYLPSPQTSSLDQRLFGWGQSEWASSHHAGPLLRAKARSCCSQEMLTVVSDLCFPGAQGQSWVLTQPLGVYTRESNSSVLLDVTVPLPL